MFRRRKSREEDLERELRSHLELEAEEQIESGRSSEEASVALGGVFTANELPFQFDPNSDDQGHYFFVAARL